jgi:MoaA/NifB/PqqE/SkfB family radical SAM enzyme
MLNYRAGNIKTVIGRALKKRRNLLKYRNTESLLNSAITNKSAFINYNKSRTLGPDPVICHAPSRSLYFDIHGNATSCCFNRSYILGKYPENSVGDIINGEKRIFLQKELGRQNFLYGCQHCLKLVEEGNYEGVEARLYDGLKNQGFTPSEITFELDNNCNLECVMCHEGFSSSIAKSKGTEKIIPPYDDKFIEQLKPWIKNLKVAKFLGGEPFLIKIYYRIWDLIIKENKTCKIHLQTNGMILNDKIREYLHKGNFYIGVSIDSLQKEKLENIRKKSDFDIVKKNLDEFINISRKRKTHLNISVCPMQQNRYEIPEIVKFCNEKKVFIYLNHVYTEGFTLSELNEEELLELLNYYKSIKFDKPGIIAKRNILFFYNLTDLIENKYKIMLAESLPYKKRHKFSTSKIKEVLSMRINNHPNELNKLEEAFSRINLEFFVSDKDLEYLKNLDVSSILNAIKNETIEQLVQRIKIFVETYRFGHD